MTPPHDSRWRRGRFTLRSVLVAVALLGLVMAWHSGVRRQRELAAALVRSNPAAQLVYDDQLRPPGAVRSWLARLLGRDAVARVARVEIEYPTDSELHLAAQLDSLADLRLERAVDVTAGGLASLARLSGLRTLQLTDGWNLDDAALGQIARLTSLEDLELDAGPRVTSDGVMKLAALSRLKRLSLQGADEPVIAALRARMPGCAINEPAPPKSRS